MKKHIKKHLPKIAGFATVALIGFMAMSSGILNNKLSAPRIDSISPAQGLDGTIVTLTGSGFSTDPQNIADYLRIEGKNIGVDQYSTDGGKTIKFTIDLSSTKDAKECVKKLSKKGSCKIGLKVMDWSTKKESNEVHFLVTAPPPPPPTPVSVPPTPVSVAKCTLVVSVSPTSSSAQNVKRGQTGVSLVKFNLTPNCDTAINGATINSFAVSLLPSPSGYLNISSLRLYNDADGSLLGSITNVTNPGLNFPGINMSILANQTLTFNVIGDISPSATLWSTVYGVFGGSSGVDNLGGMLYNNAGGALISGNTVTISN